MAPAGEPASGRVAELEAELQELEADHAARLGEELAGLEAQRAEALRRQGELDAAAAEAVAELERAAEELSAIHARRRAAEEAAHEAAREHGAATVELEQLRERLRLSPHGRGEALAARLEVEPGYEAAVAAALGGTLGAQVVSSLDEGERALVARGDEGGRALVRRRVRASNTGVPPGPGAERLADRVRAAAEVADVAQALLADAWLVEGLADLPPEFTGVAVTRGGIAFDARRGEVRRLPAAGSAQDLSERNRRAELESRAAATARALDEARQAAAREEAAAAEHDRRREALDERRRDVRRQAQEAEEETRRYAWLADQRRAHPEGPQAARRSQLEAEIAAERHVADRPPASGPGTPPGKRRSSARWSTTASRCPRRSGWWPRCRRPWPPPGSGARGSSAS